MDLALPWSPPGLETNKKLPCEKVLRAYKKLPYEEPKGLIRQFLVCFQARGAPGEGQGDPGARRRPEDPEDLLKPIGNL